MRRKRGREKVAIAVFLLAILLLGGLAIYATRRPPALVIPSESTEMVALRAGAAREADLAEIEKVPAQVSPAGQRIANAFPLLVRAHALIPERPEHLWDAKTGWKVGELGALLQAMRPDNDPKLLSFLQGCDDAVAITRQALKAETLVYPRVDQTAAGHAKAFAELGGLLAARGLLHLSTENDAEPLRCFVDSFKLALLVGSDGGPDVLQRAYSVLRPWCGADTLRFEETATSAPSGEVLQDALSELLALDARLPSARKSLEFALRSVPHLPPSAFAPRQGDLQKSMAYQFLTNWGMGEAYVNVRTRRNHRKAVTWLNEDKDKLLEGACLPYSEFTAWQRTHRLPRGQDSGGLNRAFTNPAGLLEHLKKTEAHFAAALRGAQIVMALELYRREEGAYPESLEALVPEYLPAVPQDPYSGGPFFYLRLGNDYRLCSRGSAPDGHLESAASDTPLPELNSSPLVIHTPRRTQGGNSSNL